MRIDFSRNCSKQLKKAPVEVQKAFRTRLDLFISNPHHPLLRNHVLSGMYSGCRSVNITGDWRLIYREFDSLIDEKIILLVALGTHSQLYR